MKFHCSGAHEARARSWVPCQPDSGSEQNKTDLGLVAHAGNASTLEAEVCVLRPRPCVPSLCTYRVVVVHTWSPGTQELRAQEAKFKRVYRTTQRVLHETLDSGGRGGARKREAGTEAGQQSTCSSPGREKRMYEEEGKSACSHHLQTESRERAGITKHFGSTIAKTQDEASPQM